MTAEFMSKLNWLAAVKDLAVVLISQTSVKVRTEIGAVLRPAMWSKEWSDGSRNRIVVFRDFFRGEESARKKGVRFAAVVKVNGVERRRLQVVVPFTIEKVGVVFPVGFLFLADLL